MQKETKAEETIVFFVTFLSLVSTSVRRIFEKGGGRKFENKEDQKKRSSLRLSPFFCPDLGEDQKKGLHPDSARFFIQIFCTNSKWGGP